MFYDAHGNDDTYNYCSGAAKLVDMAGPAVYVKGKVKYFQAMVLSKYRLTIYSQIIHYLDAF